MRIIAGEKRGIPLHTIEGQDTRPTLDRVKESMFSSIQFELAGRTVLDLFSGSGALGIEALSRGARSATFVDSSRACCQVIRENLERAGLFSRAQVVCGDCIAYAERMSGEAPFDLVLMDPPYGKGLAGEIFARIAPKLKKDAILVAEVEKNAIIEPIGGWRLRRRLTYRICEALIFERE